MTVTPIRTEIVQARSTSLFELIDRYVPAIPNGSILAITSKVVSLCEGQVVPIDGTDRGALITRESNYYIPADTSKFGHHFTITQDTLIGSAGIDTSNAGGYFVLWPKDSQKTANEVRAYVRHKYDIQDFGVIITDSTSQPMRLGTIGIALASSGFRPINSYIDTPDLFNRPFHANRANIAGGFAAAAVATMGEGRESTPLCLLSDLTLVGFQNADPTPEELAAQRSSLETDLFEPFFRHADWRQGEKPNPAE
jgi:F420-0:gamma-glutamyl ligase